MLAVLHASTRRQKLLLFYLVAMLAFGFVTLSTGHLPRWAQTVAEGFQELSVGVLLVALQLTYICAVSLGLPNVILNTGTAMLLARERQTGLSFGAAFLLACVVAAIGLVVGGLLAYQLARTVFRDYALKIAESSCEEEENKLDACYLPSGELPLAHEGTTSTRNAGSRDDERTTTPPSPASLGGTPTTSRTKRKGFYFKALQRGLQDNGIFLTALMRTSLPHLMINYGLAMVHMEPAPAAADEEHRADKQGEEPRRQVEPDSGGPSRESTLPPARRLPSGFPLRSFVLGYVGHVPWIVVYSWLGCSLDSLADLISGTSEDDSDTWRTWGGLIALAVTSIVLTLVMCIANMSGSSGRMQTVLMRSLDHKKICVA
ncbi:unnamed protein product [Amoebophrya sp. A120]|nr:unnamed protein product [Amoebophrya sp. A120]|eukprot:GSA120T00019474001.1